MEHIAVHLIELLKDPTCLAHVLEQDGAEIHQISLLGSIPLLAEIAGVPKNSTD